MPQQWWQSCPRSASCAGPGHYFQSLGEWFHPSPLLLIQQLSAEGIALSFISLAELYEGVFYSRDPQQSEEGLQAFLRGVELLGIDDATTRLFGRERGRLRAQGKTVGDFDLLIGATALRHGLAVLTNNRRHFQLIDNLEIVSV